MSRDDFVAVTLDGRIFTRAAILRTMHEVARYGDVDVVADNVDYIVTVNNSQLEESELRKMIVNSAVDNQLRVELEDSNAKIRGLLIAKAIESSVGVSAVEGHLQGYADE